MSQLKEILILSISFIDRFLFDYAEYFLRFFILRFDEANDNISLGFTVFMAGVFFFSKSFRGFLGERLGGGLSGRFLALCLLLGAAGHGGTTFLKSVLKAFSPADGVVLARFVEDAEAYNRTAYLLCVQEKKENCKESDKMREKILEVFVGEASRGVFGFKIVERRDELLKALAEIK
jgi:hypothetical protein